MNVHINKEKFDFLINQPRFGIYEIGSNLYNLNDNQSDKDFLVILQPFYNQIISPFNNHHQFQYKDIENNIDYNFVNIIQFISNLVTGDSVINFELIHSNQIKDDDNLSFLYELKEIFYTYNIIKAYLGFAKRDLKHYKKQNSLKDKKRKLLHAIRSYYFADLIINNSFKLEYPKLLSIKREIDNKSMDYQSIYYQYIDLYHEKINKLRNDLNELLNNKEIFKFLDEFNQLHIENKLNNILKINYNYIDLIKIYEANEKDIDYN